MTYHLPFSSFGLSSPPPPGTLWKLAIRVHNRDDAANTPIPDTWWPGAGSGTNPSGWGDLAFGLPTYQPPRMSNTASFTIRNKLNNQVVNDGMVGGSLGCGSNVADVWAQLASQAYPGAVHVNIQNEADISDWNCFSKYYITFPLSSLPRGKGVAKATVTLYEYGNAGAQGQPNPSYIQAATVGTDWNPATLSWNSSLGVQENITSIRVNTKSQPVIAWPGMAVTWDVSSAAAQAYAAGQPLRLVFYSTDNQYNTGKYFTSSFIGDWDANGRPTLQVVLGTPIASSPVSSPTSMLVSLPAHGQQSKDRSSSASAQIVPPGKDTWRPLYFTPLLILLAPLFFLTRGLWRRRARRRK
jgi:hypothetical protein